MPVSSAEGVPVPVPGTLLPDVRAAAAPGAAGAARPTPADSPIVTVEWLVRLRWAAAAFALGGWGVARVWLDLPLPLAGGAAILALMALSNVLLARHNARQATDNRLLTGVISLDVVLVTALLMLSWGPSNPFTVAYLVYITLAAVTLDSRCTVIVTGLSLLGYGSLFVLPLPSAYEGHDARVETPHLVGMWVAFVAAALLIAFFVTRIREALRRRDEALADARKAAAHQERLAALTTLAAGAAHELATPLATIAVASRDMQRLAEAERLRPGLAEDARLIREQVDRCQLILNQMSGRADETVFDTPAAVHPAGVVREAIRALPPGAQDRVRLTVSKGTRVPIVPPQQLARALASLLKNALDATDGLEMIDVVFESSGPWARVIVRDRGQGMAPDVLARAGEPFFTTKKPGSGFGLGLFLVRVFVERWGGQLRLGAPPAGGTEAVLEFPLP